MQYSRIAKYSAVQYCTVTVQCVRHCTVVVINLLENQIYFKSSRLNVVGPCNIDLTFFPMDTQTCSLTMESFTYNIDQVKMRWINSSPPITFIKPILLPDFTLIGTNASREEVVSAWRKFFFFLRRR